jgi:hypothetical protein
LALEHATEYATIFYLMRIAVPFEDRLAKTAEILLILALQRVAG